PLAPRLARKRTRLGEAGQKESRSRTGMELPAKTMLSSGTRSASLRKTSGSDMGSQAARADSMAAAAVALARCHRPSQAARSAAAPAALEAAAAASPASQTTSVAL